MSESFTTITDTQSNASVVPNVTLSLIKLLKNRHPSSQHISTTEHSHEALPLSDYLAHALVDVSIVPSDTHFLIEYDTTLKDVYSDVVAGISTFKYEDMEYRVYNATWKSDKIPYFFHQFVFDNADDAPGRKLAADIYTWADSLKHEIWVYDSYWEKSANLYKSIQASNWDDVVLEEGFKDGLRRDTRTFFSSRETYRSLGITWKRGILLLGSPGNGKTECIKALINEVGVSALYVKSFTTCNVGEILSH